MNLNLTSLAMCVFIISKSHASISSIENNFNYSVLTTMQDSSTVDSNKIISSRNPQIIPIKAMIYSSILPGMGQAYMGRWKRALIFLALEGAAVGIQYQQNSLAQKRKEKYISYATDHWNFNRWIHDYYHWYDEGDNQWNEIREVFMNTDDDYYFDIWDHSHSIKFIWDGDLISSSNEEVFKEIYIQLCGIQTSLDNPLEDNYNPQCLNTIDEIANITDGNVNHTRDHHFFEGIQKYDMFFAGWDDAKDDVIVVNIGNNIIVTSPNQTNYQSIYSNYNQIKTIAKRAGEFILINHFISMVDALFLSKISNSNNLMKLYMNVNPNLYNYGGVGALNIRMEWK